MDQISILAKMSGLTYAQVKCMIEMLCFAGGYKYEQLGDAVRDIASNGIRPVDRRRS